jgi:hypothetical protein
VLSRNRFGGGLPPELSTFYLLERLDVSWNRFVGPFTPALLSLPAIQYLNIAGNRFTGMLSDKTPCGSNLRFVDLSSNLLTGSVPTCLGSPDRKPDPVVLVSENCLENSNGSQHSSPFCQTQALAVGIVPRQEKKNIVGQAGFVAGVVSAVIVAVLVISLVVFLAVRKASTKEVKTRASAMLADDSSSNSYPSKMLADARMISRSSA